MLIEGKRGIKAGKVRERKKKLQRERKGLKDGKDVFSQ